MLPGLSVLRQVDDKYIVCHVRSNGQAPSMVLMVDQHAAHERVRLERFLATLVSQAEDEVGAHGRCFGEPCQ
jgi:DNA mismatch repair protein MLH3